MGLKRPLAALATTTSAPSSQDEDPAGTLGLAPEPEPKHAKHASSLRRVGIHAALAARARTGRADRVIERYALAQCARYSLDCGCRLEIESRSVGRTWPFANCLKFDDQGALLLTSANDGGLVLFDFDALRHQHKATRSDPCECGFKRVVTGDVSMKPVAVLNQGAAVSDIHSTSSCAWDPADANALAASWSHRENVWLYEDIDQIDASPRILAPKRSSDSALAPDFERVNALCYLPRGPGQVACATSEGTLRVWDARTSEGSTTAGTSRPTIEFQIPSRNIQLMEVLSEHSLVVANRARAGKHALSEFDLRKPLAPSGFSKHRWVGEATREMGLLQLMEQDPFYSQHPLLLSEMRISCMRADPSHPARFGLTLNNQLVCAVDASAFRLTRECTSLRFNGSLSRDPSPSFACFSNTSSFYFSKVLVPPSLSAEEAGGPDRPAAPWRERLAVVDLKRASLAPPGLRPQTEWETSGSCGHYKTLPPMKLQHRGNITSLAVHPNTFTAVYGVDREGKILLSDGLL